MAELSSNLKRKPDKNSDKNLDKKAHKKSAFGEATSIYTKIMNYLARRNHSVQELREKLRKTFDRTEIEQALKKAETSGWILQPKDLAQQTAEALHRKKKGYIYIRQYLKKKGLPSVQIDRSRELEKAKAIVSRYQFKQELSRADVAKIHRLLLNRGYDIETVRRLVNDGL